ncbi:MAG: hypothetical protein JXB10_13765 [Pirellulales bacterium]|nr:hypothetical protein [Pirellulales bacterium]
MKSLLGAVALVMLLGSVGWAQCCGAPAVATAYYSAPVAAPVYTAYYAPAPVYTSCYAPAPVYTSYYAPAPVYTAYYAPAPVYTSYYAPAVVGVPAVVRTKVYYPGQPVRNVVRAILP